MNILVDSVFVLCLLAWLLMLAAILALTVMLANEMRRKLSRALHAHGMLPGGRAGRVS